jgi:predicted PhzF superfamily epimerase YddE/YHI9
MTNPQAFIIDAFSHASLRGNAASVVILETEREAAWMQAVAAEFNLAETAFLVPESTANDRWSLRWFTPTTEVDLCGHATLASAHAIWAHLGAGADTLKFATRSGELLARSRPTPGGDAGIALDFPRCELAPVSLDELPLRDLEITAVDARLAGDDLLLVLPDADAVRAYQPDFAFIASLPWRGVIITAAHAGAEPDFVSRFFAPAIGVAEDPVTGAIHCALTPYWAEQLGKTELTAEQWSDRGGRLYLRIAQDRVYLAGQARTFLQGRLTDLG